MNTEPLIYVMKGQAIVNSISLCNQFNFSHSKLIKIIQSKKIYPGLEHLFFIETPYIDLGVDKMAYNITWAGFRLICHLFKDEALMKAYVEEFYTLNKPQEVKFNKEKNIILMLKIKENGKHSVRELFSSVGI